MTIRDMRDERGLSQEAAAEALGIKQSYYSRIERGQGNPTIGVFRRLSSLYDTKVDELVRAFIDAGATLPTTEDNSANPGYLSRLSLLVFPRTLSVAPSPLAA